MDKPVKQQAKAGPSGKSNAVKASPKMSLMKFMRQASSKPIAGSTSFGSKINIVTESCSFIPSTITSSYSLEVTNSPELQRRQIDGRKLGDLGEAAQVRLHF